MLFGLFGYVALLIHERDEALSELREARLTVESLGAVEAVEDAVMNARRVETQDDVIYEKTLLDEPVTDDMLFGDPRLSSIMYENQNNL